MTFTKRITAIMAALAIVGVSTLSAPAPAMASDHPMKPFVLISNGGGDAAATVKDVSAKLKKSGFEIVGNYSPYDSTTILMITNDTLKAAAAKSEFGAYGVAQRVAITVVDGKVQVTHTNPEYMAAAYRMGDDLSSVKKQLTSALGGGKEFGIKKGITSKKLSRYHYMPFMEYFDEPSELNTWGSYDEAVAAVEAGLANNEYGIGKVSRVDVPGKQETYFAISIAGSKVNNSDADDKWIMDIIDFGPVRSSAHLPYEVVVSGKTAYALFARFRIAQSFPDLTMMTFSKIIASPSAIEKALTNTLGGKMKSSIRGID